MAVYIVTGELGSGKSLMAVSRIQRALLDGCRVATNMDLRLERLVGPRRGRDVTRLPDWPTLEDLEALGPGSSGKFDERTFGWIVLDELAVFMNSRQWNEGRDGSNDKGQSRLKLINWLRHARKSRWHLLFISQDLSSLDKQVREALAEHVVKCRRLDRFAVPILGLVTKLLGLGALRMPQVHVGIVRYGSSPNAPIVDRWWLPNAREFHGAYDTAQRILGDNDGAATMLDARHAPYLWKPRGAWELAWELVLWRWVPASSRRRAYDDFRFFEAFGSLYKRPCVSFVEWDQARRVTAPEGVPELTGGIVSSGGEGEAAPGQELAQVAA